ncbi:hypothetical protein FGO68_gene13314 [Halteria grandinella]|uniref:Uncharacterized protein n=1 Tax=Halteria grandinella TaxID=5974 RepID=A0A8J8T3Q0_HALGN|nr:hypothetical protein FGO68_gene13314 [Halteria grandinella]
MSNQVYYAQFSKPDQYSRHGLSHSRSINHQYSNQTLNSIITEQAVDAVMATTLESNQYDETASIIKTPKLQHQSHRKQSSQYVPFIKDMHQKLTINKDQMHRVIPVKPKVIEVEQDDDSGMCLGKYSPPTKVGGQYEKKRTSLRGILQKSLSIKGSGNSIEQKQLVIEASVLQQRVKRPKIDNNLPTTEELIERIMNPPEKFLERPNTTQVKSRNTLLSRHGGSRTKEFACQAIENDPDVILEKLRASISTLTQDFQQQMQIVKSRSRSRQPLLVSVSQQSMEPLSRQWMRKMRSLSSVNVKINEESKSKENQLKGDKVIKSRKTISVWKPILVENLNEIFGNQKQISDTVEKPQSLKRSTTEAVLNTLKQMKSIEKAQSPQKFKALPKHQQTTTAVPHIQPFSHRQQDKPLHSQQASAFTSRLRYQQSRQAQIIKDQDKYLNSHTLIASRNGMSARPMSSLINRKYTQVLRRGNDGQQSPKQAMYGKSFDLQSQNSPRHGEEFHIMQVEDPMPLQIKVVCRMQRNPSLRSMTENQFMPSSYKHVFTQFEV